MSELNKLEAYLKEHKFVYRRIDKPADSAFILDHCGTEGLGEQHQIIVYDERGCRQWDAICHWGSYGYEEGLLEIYGNIVDEEKDGDTVVGYLSARDVIDRLEGRNG